MSIQYGKNTISLDQLLTVKKMMEMEHRIKNLRLPSGQRGFAFRGTSPIAFARKLLGMERQPYAEVYEKLLDVIKAEQGE